jgi:hypothetical protein
VQRAGGQVERTASGHLKITGPAGSAVVASAPNAGRAGGRAVQNTLATIRSKTGWRCETPGRRWPPVLLLERQARDRCLNGSWVSG